jgi:hypothetical protein
VLTPLPVERDRRRRRPLRLPTATGVRDLFGIRIGSGY